MTGHTISNLLLSLLLISAQISIILATTHLRLGPRKGEPSVVLSGQAVVDSFWNPESNNVKTVEWSANIKTDVVTWYDLTADNIRIQSCSANHVQLKGSMVDASDYNAGVVFVIDVTDWVQNCAMPRPQDNIPVEDDVLFYRVLSMSRDASDTLTLSIERISGEAVVPEVILGVGEDEGEQTPGATVGNIEFTDRIMKKDVVSIPNLSRRSQLRFNSSLTPEVRLGFSAGVGASISGFRLRRLRRLEFSWTQRLEAEASAFFEITKEVEVERTGRLVQVPVPNFGFRSRRIPFVGRASAGAFIRADWVLELNAGVTVAAGFDARREIRQEVRAKFLRGSFEAKDLRPLRENRQSTSLTFGAEASASIGGFLGVRPALGVEASLGSRGAGANIGVDVGLGLDTTIMQPPFEAFNGGGARIGVCGDCHALQGGLDFIVKDLTLQVERNGRVTQEIDLVSDILQLDIATICAIPRTCVRPSPLPELPEIPDIPEPTPTSTPKAAVTPSRTPTPRPIPQGSCRSCRRDRDCRSGERCRGGGGLRLVRRGRCHLILRPGQRCGGRCTVCP